MSTALYSVSFNGVLEATEGTVVAGTCLCLNTTGTAYVISTPANRGTQRTRGIAAFLSVGGRSVQIQSDGLADASVTLLPYLAVGSGGRSAIRVNSAGFLERVASPSGSDDLAGWCDEFGNAILQFGQISAFGADGQSSFTTTTAPFTSPAAAGSSIAIQVASNTWMAPEQYVTVSDGLFTATFRVNALSLTTAFSGTFQNANGDTPLHVFASGSSVVASGAPGSTGTIPVYANKLIVAQGTFPGTPNGSYSNPYTTIQAALDVAATDTVIEIHPGNYVENLVMPDTDRLSLVSANSGSEFCTSVIVGNTTGSALSWVLGADVGNFCASGIAFTSDSATDPAMNVDCSAVSGGAFNGDVTGFTLNNCLIVDVNGGPGFVGNKINSLKLIDCASIGTADLQQCYTIISGQFSFFAGINYNFSFAAGALAIGVAAQMQLLGGQILDLALIGTAVLVANKGTRIFNLNATSLTSEINPTSGNVVDPSLFVAGILGANVDEGSGYGACTITMPVTVAGTTEVPAAISMPVATCFADIAIDQVAGQSLTAHLSGSQFPRATSTITAGNDTTIDVGGSNYTQSQLVTVGSGAFTKTSQFTSYQVITPVKTSTYTAVISENVRVDPSGGAFTVTLPTAVGVSGQHVTVTNVTASTNTVTVNTTSSQTINGETTMLMNVGYLSMTLESNGTNWMAI